MKAKPTYVQSVLFIHPDNTIQVGKLYLYENGKDVLAIAQAFDGSHHSFIEIPKNTIAIPYNNDDFIDILSYQEAREQISNHPNWQRLPYIPARTIKTVLALIKSLFKYQGVILTREQARNMSKEDLTLFYGITNTFDYNVPQDVLNHIYEITGEYCTEYIWEYAGKHDYFGHLTPLTLEAEELMDKTYGRSKRNYEIAV